MYKLLKIVSEKDIEGRFDFANVEFNSVLEDMDLNEMHEMWVYFLEACGFGKAREWYENNH